MARSTAIRHRGVGRHDVVVPARGARINCILSGSADRVYQDHRPAHGPEVAIRCLPVQDETGGHEPLRHQPWEPSITMSRFAGLTPLLAPRSIAVLGASSDATRIGGRPIAYM